MHRTTLAPALLLVLLAACSPKSSTPPATTAEPAGEEKPDADGGSADRPEITAEACEAEGGKVIGDIGDGAIHQPGYRCPDSGEAPIGSVVPSNPDEPVAIEGAVCCK